MPAYYILNTILIIFFWIIEDSAGIQNVRLIFPSIVQAGTSATLLCLYDLEGASLYSVQWYRGKFEFFRFVPNENPPAKVFQIPGLYVDTFGSNEHQVTLRSIPVQLSGEFSCEITTDAPPFSTSCVSDNLTVIDFKLELKVPKNQYRFGDIITADCTLTPKLPSTKLMYHWNAKSISDKFISRHLPNSALLLINSSIFETSQPFSVTVHLRCSTLLDETYYILSKTVSFELNPSDTKTVSRAAKREFSLIFLVICILFFMREIFKFTSIVTQKLLR